MTDTFCKTRDEAKKIRKKLTNKERKAFFVKLKHDDGYSVYTILRTWLKKGEKQK